MSELESLFKAFAMFSILFFIAFIVLYIVIGKFLDNFNKLKYGQGTALAWIPFCRIYLLGKLTFNKIVGWVLIALLFVSAKYTTTDSYGVEKEFTIFGEKNTEIISFIFGITCLVLLIYAIMLYKKMKNENMTKYDLNRNEIKERLENNYYDQPQRPVSTEPPVVPPQQTYQQNTEEQSLNSIFSNSPVQNNNQNNNINNN